VRVAARDDAVPQLLERARRPAGIREAVLQGARERLAELFQRAAEELATGLELGAQPEEAEAVMPRAVEPAAELVEQQVEALAPLGGEAREPCLEKHAAPGVHRIAS